MTYRKLSRVSYFSSSWENVSLSKKKVLKNDTPENMSENRSKKKKRSRFTAWWDGNCGKNQLLSGSIGPFFNPVRKKIVRLARQWRNDRMLLMLPFWSIVHQLFHNDSISWWQTEQTYGRALGQKTRQERQDRNRDKRQKTTDESRDKRGGQGRWCGMAYTATRAAVMVGGWLCSCVLLCVVGGVVLSFVLCGNLFFWI